MADVPVVTSAAGFVHGATRKEILVCQYLHMTNSQGRMWYGGDPFAFTVPVILVQFVLIFFVTRASYFFLRPLKQSTLSAQLIAGIIIGSSFLVTNRKFGKRIFPAGGRMALETIANLGFFLHFFIIGIHIDSSILFKAGRSAVVIGISAFLVPLLLGFLAIITIPNITFVDDALSRSLQFVVMVNSLSTIPVISSLLNDLKILNSELGHLSVSCSIVNDVGTYLILVLADTIHIVMGDSKTKPLVDVIWLAGFLVFMLFALRPLILGIGKRIPEGQAMKQSQFLSIMVLVLMSGFICESLGQPAGLGTFILGISIPDGPPLGAALVEKLNIMCTEILLPIKVVIGGMGADFEALGHGNTSVIVALVLLVGYIGKFLGTLVSAISCGLPFWNSVSMSLIMCCKGIIEVGTYMMALTNGIVDIQVYTVMVLAMLIVTGVARPLICHFYDPSKRFLSHPRMSILDTLPNSELRMVVCIHNEDNVPAMISLLEASNPSKFRPISVFALNLVQLTGRASAVLESNPKKKLTSVSSRAGQILNVFSSFEECNPGFVKVQHFTAISPYVSMHNDICSVALDNSVAVIIVPFHKKWTIDGKIGVTLSSIRAVNKKVIQNAPCSVGILIDRGQMCPNQSALKCRLSFKIAFLFIGGEDDKEALAYCSRMVEHPTVTLTLVWIRPLDDQRSNFVDKAQVNTYRELIEQFRANSPGKERIIYKEKRVKDAEGTTNVVRSMEDWCDLFIAGGNHDSDSSLLMGLSGWEDCPEVGVLGEMLLTSELRFSVLVIIRQPNMVDSEDYYYCHYDPTGYHDPFVV